jgi:hypothetical protein
MAGTYSRAGFTPKEGGSCENSLFHFELLKLAMNFVHKAFPARGVRSVNVLRPQERLQNRQTHLTHRCNELKSLVVLAVLASWQHSSIHLVIVCF